MTGSDAWRVYEACLDDINAGLLGAADVSGSTKQSDGSNYTPLSLIFTVSTDVPGQTDSLYVDSIPLSAAETVSALQGARRRPILARRRIMQKRKNANARCGIAFSVMADPCRK